MALKKNTQAPKPPESQSLKTNHAPSPHKMLWSQQVELEEEARFHSSNHMPNKILSLRLLSIQLFYLLKGINIKLIFFK